MSQSAGQTVLTGPGQGVIADSYGIEWQINASGAVVANGMVDADSSAVVQIAYVGGVVWRQTKHDLRWSCKNHPTDPWGPGTEVSPVSGQAPTGNVEIVDLVNTINVSITNQITASNSAVLNAIAAFRADFDAWKATPVPQVLQAIAALQIDLDSRDNILSNMLAADVTFINGQLNQIVTAQTAAATGQAALASQVNAVQTTMAADQDALTASLAQLTADVAGAASPLPAIATLQQDFTNLTVTLNSIAVGISEKLQQILLLDDPTANATMQTEIATILTDVQQILAIVKAEEPPPPTKIVLDFEHATHTAQAVPAAKGP